MKSMREQKDSEFSRRLSNYSEEPDRDLWPSIAARLTPAAQWIVWTRRLSAFIIALSPAFFLGFETADVQNATFKVETTLSEKSNPTVSSVELCDEDQVAGRLSLPTPHEDSVHTLIPGVTVVALVPETLTSEVVKQADHSTGFVNVSAIVPKVVGIGNIPILQAFDSVMEMEAAKEPVTEGLEKSEKRKLFPTSFDLYVTVMPTLGYQRIKSNTSDNILIHDIKPIPPFSKDRLGIRLEAGLETTGSKRWKAFGGVLYFQRHQTLSYIEKRVDSLISAPGGTGSATLEPKFALVPGSMDYDVKNIGLHLGLSYRIWDKDEHGLSDLEYHYENPAMRPRKRFLHEVGGGLELHKSLKKTDAVSMAEGFTNPSLYAFFNLYYRMQYPRTGRLRAVLQPTLNYAFYINRDVHAPFYVKPYGFGLNLGCRYHL
jgi:hypothetical protein